MRVFCHEHKRGFLAPRQSPVKCENHGHPLGEIDLNGEAKPDVKTQWQYCCNCEHFCVVKFDSASLQRCPVCTRRTSRAYLCERCYTISFESHTPLQTKNFTLTAEGAPRPCCPSCLQPASADLREHTCEHAGVSFVTGLNTCPICSDRLDIGPTFPSLVSEYLRRTKVANKLYVTFDYETGLFAQVEDGEFVLVSNNQDSDGTFLLPRSPRLASLREFYELYQDYYLCVTPETGEISISEPASVVPMKDGWRLLKTGVFEVVHEKRRVKATPQSSALPTNLNPPKPEEFAHAKAAAPQSSGPPTNLNPPKPEEFAHAKATADVSTTPCAKCETPVEAQYAFCWKCGHPRSAKVTASAVRPVRSRLIFGAAEVDEEERTVQHEGRPTASSPISSLLQNVKNRPIKASGSVLRLLGVVIAGFLLMTVTLYAISRSRANDAAASQPVTPVVQQPANARVAPNVEVKPAAVQAPSATAEDSALARLRQMRSEIDSSKVLKTFSETERKFADDYRFPYERARVVVKSNNKNSQVEAFAALTRAAQKAINKGKAIEMLQSLRTDSQGDFQKLSHGHREWTQLQKALRSKDMSVLSENQGL
jgi:hypothetical protein